MTCRLSPVACKDTLYSAFVRNLPAMTNTSSNLPVCIHCGTTRPADETLCPKCGKPWIDVSVSAATPPAAAAPAGVVSAAAASTTQGSTAIPPPQSPPELDDTGEFDFDEWTLPPEPRRGMAKWLIPLVLLVAVVALWMLVFVNRGGTKSDEPIAAGNTTTTEATTTTTEPATTTTSTTTTSTSTTTTVAYPSADAWGAVGDPIPKTELGLKASGVGPITLGSPITDAAGALVASLGAVEAAGIDSDLCASQEWYWLEWGDLKAIFDGYTEDAKFIAYRYETTGAGTPDPMLETLSGIRIGNTVEVLQSTYSFYTVSFEIIQGKDHFRLLDGGELLLWGPVTSTEPQGTVEGIYSPDPCQATD